ncbi:MAG: EAL domain-containing protein [Rhodocyclales bacterium GT-UBC]|nr:MAG: EAL domain-containing protein [Rhodocyclales bacterium GT-UBC]
MFNLSRYFSTVSFILIVLAAGVLGPLYRQLAVQQMTALAEERNVAMAQVFRNSLNEPLEGLMLASIGQETASLRHSAELQALAGRVAALMKETAVVKVKVYNRLGVVIFSTDADLLGQTLLDSAHFRSAMHGEVVSELARRGASQDGAPSPVDLLASYIPVRNEGRAVEGVLELDQDVTAFMDLLSRTLWWVTGGVFCIFAGLYLMQYMVVRRAQQILEEQEGRIKAARDTLEIQVDARTDELRRANRQLEAEIAERRQAENKLNYLAYHDPLTGLANRRCFIERLEQSLRESSVNGQLLAVLFIDLDQFKQVNDSLGHSVGDELLISVAARLSENVKLIDMLARLGGDEFICLMEGLHGQRDVAILAEEIIATFEHPFVIGGHELFLSTSVGISIYPGDGASVGDLMRNADTAMYRAKAVGRGQFHFYTPEMTRDAQERIQMENLLRRALENGEMSVKLQPQVDTRSGALVGAEALVRWDSPELGSVQPSRFIPLAEDSGAIVSLGNWVLRETCRQVMQWQESGFALPMVSVNLSVKQLERPGFIETLEQILAETGMEPSRLKLEITESVVMAVTDAFDLLDRLHSLGVTLALDDFGTGYSSLSYLKMLPVQQLKIDQSFVVGIGSNPDDEAIIRTVMALARSLNFEVVAEGVETAAQAAFLAEQGCDQLQGFLHGKAVAPSEFLARWAAAE